MLYVIMLTEYCVKVFTFYLRKDIGITVQRNTTRMICGLENKRYNSTMAII